MIEWRMKAQVLGGGGPQRPFAFAPLSPSSRRREEGQAHTQALFFFSLCRLSSFAAKKRAPTPSRLVLVSRVAALVYSVAF